MTARDFALPDLGEGLPEAELVRWLVGEGDTVELNQAIAEVETAKAIVELPSPYRGTVTALHAQPGDVVDVGSVLIGFDVPDRPDGSDPAPAMSAPAPARADARHEAAATEEADAAPVPTLVGYGAVATGGRRPVRRPRRALPVDDTADHDVRAAAPHDAVAAFDDTVEERRVAVRGVRRLTAEAVVRSAFTAPHVTVFHTVDVTETTELLARWRDDPALAPARIGFLAMVAKAVCAALRRTPSLNWRWDDEHGEIVERSRIGLGIAAATDRGLLVPVIRDAGRRTLPELAAAIHELADTARAGRTAPADLRGSTFSISNIGVFGVEAGTPILNPGDAGILAVGAVQRRPWEHRGAVAIRDVVTLSLSFDHRLVDGAEGSRFLVDVADVLHEPARALTMG